MSTFDEFKKKDKSEKVNIVHVEPLQQLLRFIDEGFERYSKDLTGLNFKNNAITIGMVRDGQDLIDYSTDSFLEDGNGNPFLTDDLQFFKADV